MTFLIFTAIFIAAIVLGIIILPKGVAVRNSVVAGFFTIFGVFSTVRMQSVKIIAIATLAVSLIGMNSAWAAGSISDNVSQLLKPFLFIGLGIGISVLLTVIIAIAYITPSLIAYRSNSHRLSMILLMNLGFGWTLIGWAIAFYMVLADIQQIKRMSKKILKVADEVINEGHPPL